MTSSCEEALEQLTRILQTARLDPLQRQGARRRLREIEKEIALLGERIESERDDKQYYRKLLQAFRAEKIIVDCAECGGDAIALMRTPNRYKALLCLDADCQHTEGLDDFLDGTPSHD